MKFKLDENFGSRIPGLFQAGGHEVVTVRSEGLQGCSDQRLFEVCCSERCCLVTLDLDFAEVARFPPDQAPGMVVVRLPRNPTLSLLEQLVSQVLQALQQMPVERRLWIVEPGRVRVHESKAEEES